jgi:hypothetical protein
MTSSVFLSAAWILFSSITMRRPAKYFERGSNKLNLNLNEIVITGMYLERDIAFD